MQALPAGSSMTCLDIWMKKMKKKMDEENVSG